MIISFAFAWQTKCYESSKSFRFWLKWYIPYFESSVKVSWVQTKIDIHIFMRERQHEDINAHDISFQPNTLHKWNRKIIFDNKIKIKALQKFYLLNIILFERLYNIINI
jgi:hypothetical protein